MRTLLIAVLSVYAAFTAVAQSPSLSPQKLMAAGDRLYFLGNHGQGMALWTSDGTPDGSRVLLEANRGDDLPAPLAALGGTAFLAKENELWKSDGTAAGTVLLKKLPGRVKQALVSNGLLYLRLDAHRDPLWVTDGTEAGTIELAAATNSNAASMAARTYFMGDNEELWQTDGTRASSHVVGRRGGRGGQLVPLGGSVLLFGGHLWKFPAVPSVLTTAIGPAIPDDIVSGARTVWWREQSMLRKTDGTIWGTGATSNSVQGPMVALGDRLVFVRTLNGGQSLWISGAQSLTLLRDGMPGIGVGELFAAEGLVYFAGYTNESGFELWRTDGTAAGTRMALEIAAGRTSSDPAGFVRLGDTLYFAAYTPETGRDLWAYRLPTEAAVIAEDARVRETDGSATVTFRLTRPARGQVTVSYETVEQSAKAGRNFTAAADSVTFQAGETVKTIAIALADDSEVSGARWFAVNVVSSDTAVERSSAAVVIEDDDVAADLSLSLVDRRLIVTNRGPSLASNVVLCAHASEEYVCNGPMELGVGQGYAVIVRAFPTAAAKVTNLERDPNPSDNEKTWLSGEFIVDPAVLRAGSTGEVYYEHQPNDILSFSSSDPTILQVTPTGTSGRATLTALQPGFATITVTKGPVIHHRSVTVRVIGASEPVRLPPGIMFSADNGPHFGSSVPIVVTIQGVTSDGMRPSGTVTLLDGPRVIGTQPVIDGRATFHTRYERPGGRDFIVRYSGDANFFDGGGTFPASLRRGEVSLVAIRQGSGDVLLIVRGVPGFPPRGSIEGQLFALTPLGSDSSAIRIRGVSPTARTLSVTFWGDPYYEPMFRMIPIQEQRGRAVRH